MDISYRKLWALCAEQNISDSELRQRARLSFLTYIKLKKNRDVTLLEISKIIDALHCNISNILDFIGGETDTPPSCMGE